MEIYVADLCVFADEQLLGAMEGILPRERRERIKGYRNQAAKRRGIGAGLLLEYGLRQRGYTLCPDVKGKKLVHTACGAYGKPYFADAPRLHFNLSHTGDYAAAVFDTEAAGIDIEYCRKANLAVARRFFTVEEYAYLQSACAVHGAGEKLDWEFMRLWTRKESYIKAVGEGMHLPLVDFCVLSDMVAGDACYHLKSWRLPEEGALSVCAKHVIDAELVRVDLRKAFDCDR